MNIAERLLRLEKLIISTTKEVLNTEECAIYLNVSPDRVRHMVTDREIPCYKYRGKNYFKRSELESTLTNEDNRQPTATELKNKADDYETMHNSRLLL